MSANKICGLSVTFMSRTLVDKQPSENLYGLLSPRYLLNILVLSLNL